MVSSAISVIKTIDVDPLNNSVWTEDFAVVESSDLAFPVVSWGAHHWSLNGGLGL
jgi:hypothetical protein